MCEENATGEWRHDGLEQFRLHIDDDKSIIWVHRLIADLLYFDDQETQDLARRLVFEAFETWRPDQVPKRFYGEIRAPERRLAVWPPGMDMYVKILELTETYQVEQEAAHLSGYRPIPEEIFIVRFIQKLLVASMARIGKKRELRNILRLCVAHCQVLHAYTIRATQEIYQAMTQTEADENRTGKVYSDIKGLLLDAILDRFVDFVEEETLTSGGRRRLKSLDKSLQKKRYPWVRGHLFRLFLPPGSTHIITEPYQHGEKKFRELEIERALNKKGLHILANCATALLCPDCFRNLVAGIKVPLPARDPQLLHNPSDVLSLPVFHNMASMRPPSSRNSGSLSPEDIKTIQRDYYKHRQQIKKMRLRRLAVVVDDRPAVELDLEQGCELEFAITPKATYMRLFARDADGDLLLDGASVRSIWYEKEPWRELFVCGGGQTIDLKINPILNESDMITSAMAHLVYKETHLDKRLVLWLRQKAFRMRARLANLDRRIVFGTVVGVVIIVGLILWGTLRNVMYSFTSQDVVKEKESKIDDKSNTSENPPTPEQAIRRDDAQQPSNVTSKDDPTRKRQILKNDAGKINEETSGISNKGARLNEVKTIDIEVVTKDVHLSEESRQAVRLGIERSLSQKYSLQSDPSHVDARLKIRIFTVDRDIRTTARLVNRKGNVLVSTTLTNPGAEFNNPSPTLMNQLGQDIGGQLLQEITRKLSQNR